MIIINDLLIKIADKRVKKVKYWDIYRYFGFKMTTRALAEILAPFAPSNYSTLFTGKGGFLQWKEKEKSWSITKTPPTDPGYYADLASRIVATKDYKKVPNLQAFVQRFNCCRTLTEFPESPKPDPKAKPIFFNSKYPSLFFLSNFFPTLVLFRDHQNPEQVSLYPSSENAYQAHIVASLPKTSDDEKESKGEDTGTMQERLEAIATASPVDSKKLAALEKSGGPRTDESAQAKAALIQEVVTKKFQDNPVILERLKGTGTVDLVEDSSDSFWGSKDPYDPALKKSYTQPINAHSRNVQGRTLMAARTLFQKSSKTKASA